MGYCRQTALPAAEPVTVEMARSFLRLRSTYVSEDVTIAGMIQAAREQGEILSGRALAQRTFAQVLDSLPYYTDTIASQSAYPPSYYSLPRYSTTLWNYSQMIKLSYPPVISVQRIQYVDSDGVPQTLTQDVDFVLDRNSEPPRIFPMPGTYWPPNLYVANAVEIDFTAGYDPDPSAVDLHSVVASPPNQQPSSTLVTGIPQTIILAILNLVAYWFNNRGKSDVPQQMAQPFLMNAVVDWAPTRG